MTKTQDTQTQATTYSPIDITAELGVQLTQRRHPNFADHVPKRLVSFEEAQARGWSMFVDGSDCRYGHRAGHWVSNRNRCSDCEREKAGKQPIYPKAKSGTHYEQPRTPRKDVAAPVVIAAPKLPEPDASDKAFLASYAEHRDLDKAATAVGSTTALILSRRSHNKLLDEAMRRLETDLTIPRVVPAPSDFEWTDAIRGRLLEVYVDSGNLAIARDAVKCTPSQLWRELDANPDFSSRLDDARVRAAQVFEERAQAEALAGNDRLLPVILRAEKPEKYTEKLKLDMNVTNKLTDDQLNVRLAQGLARLAKLGHIPAHTQGEIHDAEFISVKPARLPVPRDDGSHNAIQNNGDLI